jgi:hypothetical protein
MPMGKDRWRGGSKGPPYIQLYHWVRKTEAWRSLGPYARLLYIEMRGKFNGSNNGDIPLSYREAQELLGCSNKPIPGAFLELQDRGFIVAVQKGNFDWKVRFEGKGRATTWRLTELSQDWPERELATLDFKKWEPSEFKIRHAESVPNARPERAISESMARLKRTNGTPKAGHFDENAVQHGTLKAGTSISTISPQPVGQISSALMRNLKQKGWSKKSGLAEKQNAGGDR